LAVTAKFDPKPTFSTHPNCNPVHETSS